MARPPAFRAGGRTSFLHRAWRFGAGPLFLALTAMATTELPSGIWGGEQARLDVGERQAVLKLGCAEAYLPAPLRLDARNRFTVQGHYAAFEGGPSVAREEAPPKPDTRFEGEVEGDRLTLTVHRSGGTERYQLIRGLQSKVIGCY